MAYFLSPVGNDQQVDTNGNPLVGGKLYTYLAGTTTPATTYTSNLGTTAQANPIILNALGRPASPLWMEGDIPLKFVLKTSADVTLFTVDNVVGLNDPQESFTEWVVSGLTPTYVSTTSFTVPGNLTTTFQVNRRLKYTLNGGVYYGYITASSYSGGTLLTTVTIAPDATNLDATLSAISYGFISATNTSIPQQYILAAEDKVPARGPTTNLAFLSNDATDPAWYALTKVVQVITATGTYTPTTGMVFCDAEMTGGGAGGAQVASGSYGGAGGSAGEYARGHFTKADIGASKAVTIGAGGAVNSAGGNTSLGSLLTANGASASTTGTPGAGGTGGTGTGLHIPGGQGQSGAPTNAAPIAVGGSGGASFFGSGGRGGQGGLDNGTAGGPYGSGGGGNGYLASWGNAGAGKDGVVIITEYVLTAV